MRDFAFASVAIFKVRFRQFNKLLWQITAVLQLIACGPVLNSLDWIARSQLRLLVYLRYTPTTSVLLLYIPFTVGQSHVLV